MEQRQRQCPELGWRGWAVGNRRGVPLGSSQSRASASGLDTRSASLAVMGSWAAGSPAGKRHAVQGRWERGPGKQKEVQPPPFSRSRERARIRRNGAWGSRVVMGWCGGAGGGRGDRTVESVPDPGVKQPWFTAYVPAPSTPGLTLLILTAVPQGRKGSLLTAFDR